MDWLDLVLVMSLILIAFVGYACGLLRTLIPLVGLVIGVVVAGRYYDALAHVVSSDSDTAYVAAFAIIVVAFLIAAVILAEVLHRLLSTIFLGWVDHLAGLLFGVLFGIIIAGAVLDVLLKHSVGVSTIQDSGVATFLVDKFPAARSLLPGDFDSIRVYFR